MVTSVHFEGWFQARFATDPDAYDDPRGHGGWTFAFAGEPDFDRVLRFQAPVAPRSHGPQIDVVVTQVVVGGAPVAGHPLIGAPVVLHDGPKFEGHNGDIAPDGSEPVFPFHLVVAANGVSLEVMEWLRLADLKRPVARSRFGKGVGAVLPADQRRLLNGLDSAAYLDRRIANLRADLLASVDPTVRANLTNRIAELEKGGIVLGALGFRVDYAFAVPAAARAATDPARSLGLADPLSPAWAMKWWMGCWDADALSGYISGEVKLG